MVDKVAIVTDSTICLPRELTAKYRIHVIPMEVNYNGRTYRDGVDLTPSQFYGLLAQAKQLPTTSSPSPGGCLEVYEQASQHAESILCITISAKFSAMNNAALVAKEMAEKTLPRVRIEVMDSGTAAGSEGWVVLAAARAAANGASLDEAMQAACRLMPNVHLVAMLDTLRYLVRGGRVPVVAAWATALLSIKPVFELVPLKAQARMVHRARGRKQALQRLLQLVSERTQGGGPLHALIMHANVPEEAEDLKARFLSEFDCNEIYVTDFTPVMGVHVGPGLLGTAFYAEPKVA